MSGRKESQGRACSASALEQMETSDLLALYKESGDETVKWQIVLRYEDIVKRVALQVRGVYSSFTQIDDIINEGLLTLAKSIDKFDPERGVKFETFVSKRIRGMIIDLARKQDWMPRHVRKQAKEMDAAMLSLAAELDRYPTNEEMATRLGMSKEKYQKEAARVAMNGILSLDELMNARDASGMRLEFPNHENSWQPEAVLEEGELRQALADGIAGLQKNEQIVLSLYYVDNLRLKDIAHIMDVSEPRISQLHTRALRKLRTHMETYMRAEIDAASQKDKKERAYV